MTYEANILDIVGRIYDSVVDPPALRDLAPAIAREFDGEISLLYIVQNPLARSTDLLLSSTDNFDGWAHSSYTGYYRQRDVWGTHILKRVMKQSGPEAVHGLDLVEKSTLHRSEVFSDWYDKVGMSHAMAALFPVRSDLGVFSIGRPRGAADFERGDQDRLALLVPHFQRAVQIHQKLTVAAQQSALTFDVLERLALGIFVVGADTRVTFANSVARRFVQPDQPLTVSRGRLRARSTGFAHRLDKLIGDAALTSVGKSMSAGGFLRLPRPAAAPLTLLVSPYCMRKDEHHAVPTAMILFVDPDSVTQAPEDILAQMFGLSPAEARLVSALVNGRTMADYADAVGVSINTAKTQMRQIFLKTGYNRQADVIRAALSNPLVRLGSGSAGSG